MNWKAVGIIAAILVTGGIGYAAYRYVKKQQALAMDYGINLIAVRFLKMTKDEWIIRLTVRFKNKSSIEAILQTFYSDIFIRDKKVSDISIVTPKPIPAKGSADIDFEISVLPKKIFGDAVGILMGLIIKKDLPYRMKGNAEIKSAFVTIPVEFDESGTLKDFL